MGNITYHGKLEQLSLVGFDHQNDPEDKLDDPHNRHDGPTDHRDKAQYDVQGEEEAEGDDGLHRMETDEFVLFFEQEEDHTRDNAGQVAQKSGQVRLHAQRCLA